MSLGSGRVIYQNITRIDQAIADGSFDRNPAYCSAIDRGDRRRGRGMFGLLSAGGVHSHEQQIFAAVRRAARGAKGFTCTPSRRPRHPAAQCRRLAGTGRVPVCRTGLWRVASITGRYYAMDGITTGIAWRRPTGC